ncbi:Cytochrome c, class III, conserved region [Thermodesulfatator indicus DSM 15286]|uniref:Cytochrome c, class III, conserved region n=1 Tax=Thermodesulfatator indicus (strain DSM 15286 / JCM 11887 / CIR29812) TaxID=667014 RepID=F8A8M9_THEID|nr:cytochrome c3 family protein [Thermodesulfatator indicus]AEH45118.1 Cytochrome c, class III, conserved region [Thermodesulfatator indicus DSM 15286]
MKKVWVGILGLIVGLAFYGYAISGDNGPEVITFEGGKKGTVTFHHLKHQKDYGIKCGECHHGKDHSPYKEGMKIQKCSECHNKDMANKKLNSVKKAMHKNCKGCHKQVKDKHPNAPTKCKECHIKK